MEGDEDLFPNELTLEEQLDRKIEGVRILLDRFQEKLECAADLLPSELLLERAELIRKDFEDITTQIKDLKRVYSKRIE